MAAPVLPVTFPGAPGGARVAAGFTTRHGGVSAPPFAGLNCGYSAGDDPAAVWENRRRALTALGLPGESLVVGGQVHGTRVAVVTATDRGRGARGPHDVLPETDGLLTDVRDLPLGVSTADCVPVFLYAPAARVVGVLHAGWRGTLRGILGAALDVLRRTWHTTPETIHVAFGPAIGVCCYEVGADVADEAAAHPVTGQHLRPTGPGKWHLNLPAHLAAQCVAAGVPRAQVAAGGPCTKCDTAMFYSYRAEGPRSGRTLSVIAVREAA